MLRFYFSHEQDFARDDLKSVEEFSLHVLSAVEKIARTKPEKTNLTVTALVLKGLPPAQVDILREVFGGQDQIAPAVRNCAGQLGLKERVVWDNVRSASHQIAVARGLI